MTDRMIATSYAIQAFAALAACAAACVFRIETQHAHRRSILITNGVLIGVNVGIFVLQFFIRRVLK